jgi:hypothetical protein
MKTLTRIVTATALIALSPLITSCTTTYDAAGRPVQSVDPGTAAAGAVAAGALGYAIGQNNDNDRRYYGSGYRRPYYNNYHGRRGYRR